LILDYKAKVSDLSEGKVPGRFGGPTIEVEGTKGQTDCLSRCK
jgi:hypothetical protein